MTINPQDLCMKLIRADSEDEVITILKNADLWDDRANWRDFGDNDNNFSTAGAQQADPIAALVEKLVNSADARLTKECYLAGFQPDSENAPPSVRHAVAQLIEKSLAPEKETNGRIENWTATQRRENAQKITLSVTGKKKNPCITIVDFGEGQTPSKVPETFMSLNKSNKLRIPFVQGKFNMGGTGVFRFCGNHSLQLVLTRRCPGILPANHTDGDKMWSFSIVRRDDPTGGEKNSVYRYLAPIKNSEQKERGVLRFSAESLDIFPEGNVPYARPATHGSLVKLYNYKFKGQSSILLKDGLFSSVGIRLPNPALPIMFHECRDYGGKGGSYNTPFTGLVVRLSDDRAGNQEEEFPCDELLTVEGQTMNVKIFGFKQGKADTYRNKSEGILFVVNGQTQGTLHARFFKRRKVRLGYVADSLLVYVDCSKMDRRAQEELFMNTRESLAESEFRFKVEKELEKLVKDNSSLRQFNTRRREEKVRDKIGDDKTLEDTLNKIMQNSPTLSALFLGGQRLSNAFETRKVDETEKFVGKLFPSFFRFKNQKYGHVFTRNCEVGRTARLQFETDVENSYFGRSKEAGVYSLRCECPEGTELTIPCHKINLINGVATLSVDFPDKLKVGEQVLVQVIVEDDSLVKPFENQALLTLVPKTETVSTPGPRIKPPSSESGDERLVPSGIALPNTILVEENRWNDHDFDKFSALKILQADEESENGNEKKAYDFYINMDNFYLLNELKRAKGNEELIREQFKVGLILLGLALIHDSTGKEDDGSLEGTVFNTAKAMAMMLIPMIQSLGALDIETDDLDQEAA